ncbi:MAG: DUF2877 domain-containing protein [Chloroflexi bacterium]|nr:DUF2877 domain-containing protein [Chloroflexota bacterium]
MDSDAAVPSTGEKIPGKVLTVSRSSALIDNRQGGLFTILNIESGGGPNYIILKKEAGDLRQTGLYAGQEVIFTSRGIESPGVFFMSWDEAAAWRLPPVPEFGDDSIRESLAALGGDEFLNKSFQGIRDSRFCETLISELEEMLRRAAGMDSEGVKQCAARIAGRGEGSTPAGDDLLTGVIAVLIRFEQSGKAQPKFLARLLSVLCESMDLIKEKTTYPSASYLEYCMDGRFSHPLCLALDGILSGEAGYDNIKPLLSCGATSGPLILLAMLMTLKVYLEEKNENIQHNQA